MYWVYYKPPILIYLEVGTYETQIKNVYKKRPQGANGKSLKLEEKPGCYKFKIKPKNVQNMKVTQIYGSLERKEMLNVIEILKNKKEK